MLSRWQTFRLFLICLMISIVTNFSPGVMNSSVNTAVHEFRSFLRRSFAARGISLENLQTETLVRSVVLNTWFVGQIIGAISLSSLAERYGRKGAFAISISAMAFGSVSQFGATLLNSPELFVLGRFTAAMFSPLCDFVMLAYFQESTPIELRGMFSALAGIGYSSMSAFGMWLGTMFGDSFVWLFALQWPPVLLSLLFVAILPETPKFLACIRNDKDAALRSLAFFQGYQLEHLQQISEFRLEIEVDKTSDLQDEPVTIKEILTTPYLRFSMLLSLSVFVMVLPLYPFLLSSTYLFEKIGIELRIAEFSSTAVFVTFALATGFGAWLIERHPRRRLLLTSAVISIVFLSAFVFFASISRYYTPLGYIAIASVVLFIIPFGAIVGPMSWFIGTELVTQRYRAMIFGIVFGCFNVFITITNSVALLLFEHFGALSFIPLFIVPSIVTLEFLRRHLPESRGRAPVEVAGIIKRMVDEKTNVFEAERREAVQQAKLGGLNE
ncbi:Solute carrier family 2, facilitated glucose transporter member 1 [Aphelenchoides besseyi]|nr:Solute carrier family 2, facilitated glucose transporter member 1 [Aphelenchoides besseyi]